MQSKRSLADLVSRIDWVMIENKWGSNVSAIFNPDGLKVCLEGKTAKSPEVVKLSLSLGCHLLQKLGWNYGDKISFFHHPDDLLAFRAVRDTHGYKIGRNKGSSIGKIQVRWPHTQLGIKKMKAREIEYVVHGDQLLFIIPSS